MVVEAFTESDTEGTDAVLRKAYRTERPFHARLKRHLYAQPGGSFVAKLEGRVVGFGSATDYGRFSYIGLMATHPDVQRLGVGRRVLETLLRWLEARGCPTALLDATPSGAPLYEKFGFVNVESTLVLKRQETRPNVSRRNDVLTLSPRDLPQLVSFDAPIFGAPRGKLLDSFLREYPDRFLVSRRARGTMEGFLVAQPSSLGPWIALGPKTAEGLLSKALEFSYEGEPQVSLSASNYDAITLLRRFGFKEERSLRHMVRGKTVNRARATRIFGQASLAFG